jgi:hypothetical protein
MYDQNKNIIGTDESAYDGPKIREIILLALNVTTIERIKEIKNSILYVNIINPLSSSLFCATCTILGKIVVANADGIIPIGMISLVAAAYMPVAYEES